MEQLPGLFDASRGLVCCAVQCITGSSWPLYTNSAALVSLESIERSDSWPLFMGMVGILVGALPQDRPSRFGRRYAPFRDGDASAVEQGTGQHVLLNRLTRKENA
jgi:hypothetical protein